MDNDWTGSALGFGDQSSEPLRVVRALLEGYDGGDLAAVFSLVAEDVEWVNVPLPAVRGRKAFERANRALFGPGRATLRVHIRRMSADGEVVLAERFDGIVLGRFEVRLTVRGRFVVREGRVHGWRDTVDLMDMAGGVVRGLAGLAAPRLNRPWPGPA